MTPAKDKLIDSTEALAARLARYPKGALARALAVFTIAGWFGLGSYATRLKRTIELIDAAASVERAERLLKKHGLIGTRNAKRK